MRSQEFELIFRHSETEDGSVANGQTDKEVEVTIEIVQPHKTQKIFIFSIPGSVNFKR